MRNQKGITLVALVITIIVLLILAGVSISLVLGQNGVLTNASNAVVANEKATAQQEIQMASSDAVTAYYSAWSTNQSVKRASYYTTDVFANNCSGAKQVAITAPNEDNTTVYVKYTANSNAVYYYAITVADGKIAESNATAAANATTNCISGS